MKIISDDGKIRVTDLNVDIAFMGGVVRFDGNKLYVSEPSSIHEFVLNEDKLTGIIHDFKTLPTYYSTEGYIFDFSICDINKNLIAIASMVLLDDDAKEKDISSIYIYDKSKKEIVWLYPHSEYDWKLIWKDGILYYKRENGEMKSCFNSITMDENIIGLIELDKLKDDQLNKIKFNLIQEFNLYHINNETYDSRGRTNIELYSEERKLKVILDDNFPHINSITANATFDKFVFALYYENYILVEILNN